MGRIEAVCVSDEKGVAKREVLEAVIREDFGLEGDAHAGSARQVSLLLFERVREFEEENGLQIMPGAFGENLLVSGLFTDDLKAGARLCAGNVIMEITQLGKECHEGCTITRLTGKCIMPKEGIFARVIRGGRASKGDEIELLKSAVV